MAVGHVHNVLGISEDVSGRELVLGISEDVSGRELADHALEKVETYGRDIYFDVVEHIDKGDGENEYPFRLEAAHATIESKRVVLATGFRDHSPDAPELR
ncbi:hypothetical protein [Halostagnicola bangensis]